MTEKIDIRVAKILELDRIVINKGKADNIDEHMEFLIYDEGEEIIDPVSGKSLGLLENPKGIFKVMHIQENVSILLSKTKRPNKMFAGLNMYSDIDIERDLLKSIKIGDKVKITNQTL
ncbi:hypothetical protein CLV94_2408 [Flavobacterium endophyticum]|uniref:Uncharacterized protein n=1 Tax=Flavobacterium endophyticum TaxID=1540163 RepID=A0A495MAL2_9FLAO|nr:hypothetical protein [Flavobacterium endophyticum]RKS21773.1 hypothetical protein CLV94_2408 [Flavobacterium endophyticum]